MESGGIATEKVDDLMLQPSMGVEAQVMGALENSVYEVVHEKEGAKEDEASANPEVSDTLPLVETTSKKQEPDIRKYFYKEASASHPRSDFVEEVSDELKEIRNLPDFSICGSFLQLFSTSEGIDLEPFSWNDFEQVKTARTLYEWSL